MGPVFTRCPTTNVPIFTGLSLDRAALDARRMEAIELSCTHCWGTHRLTLADSYIAERLDVFDIGGSADDRAFAHRLVRALRAHANPAKSERH